MRTQVRTNVSCFPGAYGHKRAVIDQYAPRIRAPPSLQLDRNLVSLTDPRPHERVLTAHPSDHCGRLAAALSLDSQRGTALETVEQYAQQINEAEAKATQLRNELAANVPHTYGLIAQWARSWTEQFVDRQVREEAAVTKSLSQEDLAAMKREIAAYLASLPDRTNQVLDGAPRGTWLHRPGDGDSDTDDRWYALTPVGQTRPRIPRSLEETLRKLLGGILPILRNRGYFTSRDGHESSLRTGQDRYPYAVPDPPGDVIEAMVPYAQQRDELIEVSAKLRALRRLKEEAEAADLWRKA